MAKNNRESKPRILYIDNLRIFLTGLVVLHHLAITYGAPGGWFYNESSAEFPEIIPLSMFVATNQSFFMGMFFFISAYFMSASMNKKGPRKFLLQRLIRLGIPTALFYFILYPLTVFITNKLIYEEPVSLVNYLYQSRIWGFGPMWFVEALLVFTLIYALCMVILGSKISRLLSVPNKRQILLFALFLGLGQFIIRIWLPVGWAMSFTNFQLPHFLQYIFLFVLGIVAHHQNWLSSINRGTGWSFFLFVQILVLIGFPVIFILGGATEIGIDVFMGGLTWQSLIYAIWEQMVGIGMIVALLGLFKFNVNSQNFMARKLSGGAYAVYVIHAPVLVLISFTFLSFEVGQFWKFVLLSPLALICCFTLGILIKQLPLARNIF